MDRLASAILLENQETGALGIVGVLLDHNRVGNRSHHVSDIEAIGRHLIVAVIGYSDIALLNQAKDSAECSTHNIATPAFPGPSAFRAIVLIS